MKGNQGTPDREFLIAARHNDLQPHDASQTRRLDALVAKGMLTSKDGLYRITQAGRLVVRDVAP